MRSEVENESILIKKIQKHYDRQAADVLISAYYEEIYALIKIYLSIPKNGFCTQTELFHRRAS